MSIWRAWQLIALLAPAAAGLQAPPRQPATSNEFFALDTAMVRNRGTDLIQRADIERLAALGYPGLAMVVPDAAAWQHLTQEVLPWLEQSRLKLYAVFSGAQVSRGQFTYDPELKRHLPLLKRWGTVIWLPISSKEFRPSDAEADPMAVAAVREVADSAAEHGLTVSIYPHVGNLVERVSDAVRIAGKAGRANVGVTFNLCHWLRTDGPQSTDQVLKLALPRLSLVTINGADRDGKEWIQPLDSGDFDLAAFLRELQRLGYRGPIGLQGHGVAVRYAIDPAENLKRSMAAWKRLTGAVATRLP